MIPRIFRHLQPKHPVLVLLRDRSRLRADLVKRRTQLSQKMQLLRYFPAMWQLAPVRALGSLVRHPVGAGPDPERARRLHRGTVVKLLARCKIRRTEEVVGVLRQPALVVAPGVTDGATIGMLLAQLKLVHEQVKAVDRGIELLEELPAALGDSRDEGDVRGLDPAVDEGGRRGGRRGTSTSGAPSN